MGTDNVNKFNKGAADFYNSKKVTKESDKRVYCCQCKDYIKPDTVKGDVIYPNYPQLREKLFYQCRTCKNYCGRSNADFVSIPTPEVRAMRKEVHDIIDPLWRGGLVGRGFVYKCMSEAMGYDYHNSSLSNMNEARKALKAAKSVANKAYVEHLNNINNRKSTKS